VSTETDSRQEQSKEAPPPAFVSGNGGSTKPAEAARPAAGAQPTPVAKGWQYTPHVVVFCSAACIMVVELVAGRLIGRHLGSSLYTWTSIIGVILAGMSLGNYIGGRMADRWKPERFVGLLFLASSVVCLSTLFLNHIFAVKEPFEAMRWPWRVFLSVLTIFTMPALVLGTISPAMAKMALERSKSVGATIGSVYAWATVGSIVGTLATGFYLIALLGAQGLVLTISLGLALIGLVMGPHRWLHAIWVVALGVGFYLSFSGSAFAMDHGYTLGLREDAEHMFGKDSDYQYVKVYKEKSGKDKNREIRVLALDYLIHGYIDAKDPTHLEYDYEKVYRDVARRLARGKKQVAAFFLGGGSYTFPRWVVHEWPGARAEVAELDPLVVEANHAALGLPRNTSIKTYTMDARNAVDSLRKDNKFDLIFGDAFNDLSVPWHLTTVEFVRKLRAHLNPDGAYLANIIEDIRCGQFLGATYNTLKKVFKHVVIFCTEKEGISDGRETFVVAASDAPIQISDWMPGHSADFIGSALTDVDLAKLYKSSKGRVLTDDDSPVENLLECVVRNRK
jgi:spermidine synthase